MLNISEIKKNIIDILSGSKTEQKKQQAVKEAIPPVVLDVNVLAEIVKEISLIRQLKEGSLKYNKEKNQYENEKGKKVKPENILKPTFATLKPKPLEQINQFVSNIKNNKGTGLSLLMLFALIASPTIRSFIWGALKEVLIGKDGILPDPMKKFIKLFVTESKDNPTEQLRDVSEGIDGSIKEMDSGEKEIEKEKSVIEKAADELASKIKPIKEKIDKLLEFFGIKEKPKPEQQGEQPGSAGTQPGPTGSRPTPAGTQPTPPGQPGTRPGPAGTQPGPAGSQQASYSNISKPVSNEAAFQLVKSKMGFDENEWIIFRESVAQIESNGRYDIAGGSGNYYDGRYQMGADAKTDGARMAGVPNPGHSKDPSDPRRVAFRENPGLQELLFAGFTAMNHAHLKTIPQYREKSKAGRLQILGYAHNQGMGGAERWLKTGVVGADGFGTKGTKYTDLIAANFKALNYTGSNETQPASASVPSPIPQSSQTSTARAATPVPNTPQTGAAVAQQSADVVGAKKQEEAQKKVATNVAVVATNNTTVVPRNGSLRNTLTSPSAAM